MYSVTTIQQHKMCYRIVTCTNQHINHCYFFGYQSLLYNILWNQKQQTSQRYITNCLRTLPAFVTIAYSIVL